MATDKPWMPDQSWLDKVEQWERMEADAWKLIADSTDETLFHKFMQDWTEGPHWDQAQQRLEELKAAQALQLPGMPPSLRLAVPLTWIESASISADGKIAIAASAKGTITIWDVTSGTELRVISGHKHGSEAVAISPDGSLAVSCGEYDGTIKLWDVATGNLLRSNDIAHAPFRTVFSSDCRFALAASRTRSGLRLLDTDTGNVVREFQNSIISALSANGKLVATTESHPDGTIKSSGAVMIWDVASGSRVARVKTERQVMSLYFHPSSPAIFAGYGENAGIEHDHAADLWDWHTGHSLTRFTGRTSPVTRVSLSADGSTAISAGSDFTHAVWDVASGLKRHTLVGDTKWSGYVGLSGDGKVAISNFGALHIWNFAD